MNQEVQYKKIQQFLESLGLEVEETSLPIYIHAFTHSSFTYEYKLPSRENYERLEFLGDAVLKIIISQYIFERFPYYREGELTKIRAVIVSDTILSKLAKQIKLGDYMIFGPSEARSGGRNKDSNLACAFEAFLGALFLDGQMTFATKLVEDMVQDEVTKVDLSKTKDNYKAVLQELLQQDGHNLPDYLTVQEEGPAHSKIFHVEVLVNEEVLGRGSGKSKKEAQQMAAKMALKCLDQLADEEEE